MTSIKLKHPITVDGKELDTINMRRPVVRDMLTMDRVNGQVAATVKIIADLAELTTEQVHQIDAADYRVISETFAGFLADDRLPSGA